MYYYCTPPYFTKPLRLLYAKFSKLKNAHTFIGMVKKCGGKMLHKYTGNYYTLSIYMLHVPSLSATI